MCGYAHSCLLLHNAVYPLKKYKQYTRFGPTAKQQLINLLYIIITFHILHMAISINREYMPRINLSSFSLCSLCFCCCFVDIIIRFFLLRERILIEFKWCRAKNASLTRKLCVYLVLIPNHLQLCRKQSTQIRLNCKIK